MSKVNGQSVADREEHVGGTHPYFFFSRETWTCGLWPVVRACGRDPPFFPFPLEGWGNTPSPLVLEPAVRGCLRNFLKVQPVGLPFL